MKFLNLLLLLLVIAMAPAQNLQDSLQAYYPFNGNANDMSGHGNNGQIIGAVFSDDAFGQPQSALLFDGVDDYVQIPHQNNINYDQYQEFTISLWIRAAKKQLDVWPGQNRNVLLSKWENNSANNDNYPYNIRIFNDNLSADEGKISTMRFSKACNYNPLISSSQRVNDSLWHHVVMMRENGSLKLFIDCQPEASLAESDTCPMINNHDLFLGRQGGILSPAHFHGSMDEVRIYNRALDATEISSLCEPYVGQVAVVEEEAVKTYPNPARDKVSFEFDDEVSNDLVLAVFDQYGHSIDLEVHRQSNRIILNTSAVASGIYHYQFQNANSGFRLNGRFIVER